MTDPYLKQLIKNILLILNSREKQQVFKLAVLDILISILDILFLVALLFVINFYTSVDHSANAGSSYFHFFIENPLSLIIVFFILFSMKNLLGYFIFKLQYNFVYGVASRISAENLLQYLQGSYHNYVNIDSSVYHRKISQQPIEFCHYVLNGMQQVFSQAILITISAVAILIYNPLLFPLLVLVLAPPVFLIAFIMKQKLGAVRLHSKKTSEQTIQHLQEALAGFVESNVYGKNDFFTSRYQSFQSRLNHYLAENQVIHNMPSRLIEVFAVFGFLILILLNSFTSGLHSIPVITIGAFMAAAYKVIPGIVKIMNMLGQVKTYSFTITDLLNSKATLYTKKENRSPIDSVSFEHIHFSYADKKVLDSFSLNLERGDLAGISGISGKGKTTIANLLLGFLSPDSGSILINGSVTNTADRQAYWNKISYIKQQPFFIHDTVLKNICLQEDGHDKNKLANALTLTAVDKLVETTAGGLDAMITEHGKNFSGGQRQRIIFARALYKDFDCLVLDEPFNELDEVSEIKMLQELRKIADEGKIVLLITHNKAALSFCNKKILLDEYGA